MIISLAERLQGIKPYYFVKKLEQVRQYNQEGKDVINFGIGSPDLPPSKRTLDALVQTALQANSHGYQPYRGVEELRQGIADWYNRTYEVNLDPSTEVLPLMGSKEGILHMTLAFVNHGDEVLVPNPGYPTYTSLSRLLGAEVRYYDLKEDNNWYPDFDALEQMDLSKVRIMWVNYPHMPTGTPAKRDVFEKLVAFAKKHKILLCHDNPYSLVLNQQKPMSILSIEGAEEVAVEFNSFSKSHNMAGWRVGMLVGNEEYLKAALRVKSNIDSGMFLGTQRAAIEALAEEDIWHYERNEVYKERREWIWKILDLLGFTYDKNQEGMFVWAKPVEGKGIDDIPAFVDEMLEKHYIFFTPGMIFGSNGKGYLRLSLCVSVERAKLAYERLKSNL
ncbi:MAG: aminotransferase class I/II-fold pyridoxal phosphate-dependent enzyme [Cytophagales bacterium]|nr:aminotransferase class I/II-fold pyridoxal phosphate-dependent enzyme [Cytophagales bacterium]